MGENLDEIWEIICDPNIYSYAYENCEAFRIFINSLPEATMFKIKKNQSINKASNVVRGIRKGQLHLATFGLSFAAEKLFMKGKNKKIAELVDSEGFANIFKTLYSKGIIFE